MRTSRLGRTLVLAFALGAPTLQAQIASDRLEIRGLGLTIETVSVTTAVDVATTIQTAFGGKTNDQAVAVPGLLAVGELTGPGIDTPIRLTTPPGRRFSIPGLSPKGIYFLQNIRLMNGDSVLRPATPSVATITVADLVQATLKVRQLTPEEIRSRGIVVDARNYEVYEYTFSFLVNGQTVEVPFPVIVDPRTHVVTPVVAEKPYTIATPKNVEPPRWAPPDVIPFEFPEDPAPFDPTEPVPDFDKAVARRRPPIPAALVIPNSFAVLHQFFAVALTVTNGAPDGSTARLEDISATLRIKNPLGLRAVKSKPAVVFGQAVPLVDAKTGVTVLFAQAKAEAEWTLEGLKPGTHTVEVDLRATFKEEGQEPVPLRALPTASIVIHDPRFSITFSHPDTVREGLDYSTFAFITNMSPVAQTIRVTDGLPECIAGQKVNVCRVSGARAGDLTLASGEMRLVEYKLRSGTTGKVFATAGSIEGENLSASVQLHMGVSESGIALSPSTLILPHYAQYAPPDLVSANLQLLGLGYSVATAPLNQVTASLPRVIKTDVFHRASDVARAGQRIFITNGSLEGKRDAIANLTLDLLGNGVMLREWDELRRRESEKSGRIAGAAVIRELMRVSTEGRGTMAELVDGFASTTAYRGDFVLALIHSASGTAESRPLELSVRSAAGRITSVANEAAGGWNRQIAFADLSRADGFGRFGELAIVGRWTEDLELVITPAVSGSYDLEILIPASAERTMLRAHLTVSGTAGETLRVPLTRGATSINALLPNGGFAATTGTTVVAANPLQITGARQDLHLDPAAHKVSMLFNRPVSLAAGTDLLTRFTGAVKLDRDGVLYEGPRPIFAAGLQEDGRVVTLSFDHALSTNASYSISVGPLLDPLTGSEARFDGVVVPKIDNDRPAGILYGKFLAGDSKPIAGGEIKLYSGHHVGCASIQAGPGEAGVACNPYREAGQYAKTRDDGSFLFEAIVRDPEVDRELTGSYRVVGVTVDGRYTLVDGSVRLPGKVHVLNLQLLGRGAAEGVVRYDNGEKVSGARVYVGSTMFNIGRETTTNASGFFRVEDLPVGPVTFSATDAAGNVAWAAGEIATPGQVAVKDLLIYRKPFPGTGTVYGRVRRSDTGEPVFGARVGVYTQGYGFSDAMTDSDGRFEFRKVPSGFVTVLAAEWSVSRESAASDFDLRPDEAKELNLTLAVAPPATALVTLEGDVVRENALDATVQEPVAGAVVKLGALTVTADAAGHFRLEGLPILLSGKGYSVKAYDPATKRIGEAALPTLSETGANYLKVLIPANSYGTGTIRVRVLDAQGLPVAGMRVIEPGYPPKRIAEVGGGLYEWKDAPVGAARNLYAVNAPAKYGDQFASGRIGLQFPGQTATLVLRLPGQGTVRARLRGDLDLIGPVTLTYDAWDELEQGPYPKNRDGSTNENGVAGWATFTAVPAVKRYVLESAHPSYGYAAASGTLGYDGDLAEHTLQMSKLASIRGVVSAIDGITPIASAAVRLHDGARDAGTVYSQPDGSFAFHDVPSGVSFTVTADVIQEGIYRVGMATGRTPSTGGPAANVSVILRRRGSVEGRVVYAAYKKFDPENPANNVADDTPNDLTDNAPAPLAKLWLKELEFPGRTFGTAADPLTSDIGGRFALSSVFVGSLRARAWDATNPEFRGDWTGTLTFEGEILTGPAAYIAIGSGGAGTVQVTVADPNQQYAPVANAEVQLFRGGSLFDTTSTDGAGVAWFEQLPTGNSYSVGAYSKSLGKSGGSSIVTVERDRQTDVRVLLEFVGKVDGKLSDPESSPAGKGLPGVPVLLRGSNYTTQASTDTGGLFFFEGVREGRFDLWAKDTESNRRATATGVLTAANRHPYVDLELERTFPLHAAVYLPDDRGANSGKLAGTFEIDVLQRNGEYRRTLQGNSLEFPGLFVSDTWSVIAREIGGAGRILTATGKHPQGSSTDPVRTVYPAFGDVEVTVTQAGALASGVRVEISAGNSKSTLYTDGTGRVLTHSFPLNVPVSIQAKSIDGRFSGSASVRIERQSVPARATIDLGEFATITGLVEAEAGGPSVGTRVLVTFSGRTLEILTDADGRYRFNGIPTSVGGTVAALNYVGPDGVTAGGSQSVVLTNADAAKVKTLPTIRLDATPPQLLSVIPADGAASVSPDTSIRLVFSEPIQTSLVTNGNLQLIAADGSGQVQCSFEQVVNGDGTYGVTMRPPAAPAGQRFPLKSNTLYRIVVVDRIADLSGHRLPSSRGLTFTTADYAEPRVVKIEPVVNTPVPQQVTFAFHFNEPIDPAPWAAGGGAQFRFYKLSSAGSTGQVVAEKSGRAYVDPATATTLYFAPAEPIEPEAFYRVVFNGVRDPQGNALGEQVFHFFSFDNTAPFVRIVSPVPDGTHLVSGVEYTLTPDVRNGTAEGTPASDVASVEYSRIDGAAETFLTKVTAAPFNYRFVAPDASPEGMTLTVRAKAFDKSGNVSQPATASWTVKPNAAPSSIAVKLTPASAYPSNNVSADVTFTDEGIVATVQVVARGTRVDGSEYTESKSNQLNRPTVGAAWPAATFAFALPSTLKAQTSASFTASVTDVRGLKGSATAELPLLADGVAPVIHSVKPDPETTYKLNSTYQVEAVVSDAETAVAQVSFSVDERTYVVTTSVAGPTAGTRKFVSPAITVPAKNVDTRVAIVVTAKDHQGNTTARTIEIVYLGVNDPTVPRAAWLCPIDRGALPAAQSGYMLPLRVRASDDIAITSVKFNVPGIAAPIIAQRVGTTDEYEATATVTTPAGGTPFAITAVVSDADPAHTVELPIALEIVAVDRIIDAVEAIDADTLAQYQNKSLAVRGAGRLVANVPVVLANLLVLDGARVEALPTTTAIERRIEITVVERLYVDCASTIDMTARGYLGGWQENAGGSGTRNEDARGRTVGNSVTGGASGTSASHAGVGGVTGTNGSYGSIAEPAALGSGGAGATACCTAGAAGGGAIAIQSNGRITIAGTIAADGGSGVDRGGAGAGGSIRLSADHVAAGPRARITANGGDDNGAAGGGGGRIAIRATTRLTFEGGTIQARGGRHANGAETRAVVDGGAGTIHLMRPGQTGGELLMSAADDRFPSTQHLTRPTPVATALALDGLTIGPRALVRLDSALTVPSEATAVDPTALVVGPTDVPTLTITPTPAAGATLPRASSLSINYTVGSAAGVESVTFLWPAGGNRTEPVPLYPTSFNSAQPVTLPVATDASVGAVSLITRVTDRAGRTFDTTPVQYTVADNTAPAVGSFAVTPANLYPGHAVTATVSASDDVAITKITATAIIGTTTTSIVRQPKTKSVTNETFVFDVPQTTPGATPMQIEIALEDGYPGRDAVRRTASVTIEKDAVAPQVSILEPAADHLFDERSGATFVLRATATDVQVAVKTVTAKVGEAAPVTMTFSNNEWRATLPVPNVDGTDIVSIPVVVTAVDFEGNGANAPLNIRVRPLNDPNGPKANWTCGTEGAMYPAGYAAKFRVAASGATPANGVQKVEIALDGGTPVLATAVSGLAGHYEASLTIPDLADGAPVIVRAVATSVAGNQNEIATRVTVIRTEVPPITVDLTIDNTNAATYENKTVVVQSGTVTIVGARTFDRLVVLNGAVRHSSGGKLDIQIQRSLYVACSALINADALGYAAGQAYPGATASGGNSGGSHIGRGGIYNGSPGTTYGSIYRPQEVGGGSGASATTGGGAIRIRAAQAVVEGAIRANGGGAGWGGRGSAGGSVWVTVDRIVGAGQIEANGGNGEYGAGGGGAVAIEYGDATSVMPTLQARTVSTYGRPGGAGSVYKRGPASTYGDVVFDNGSGQSGVAELPSLGRGIALTGTSGNVLVTDRPTDVPAYFAGHWIEIKSASGQLKGAWRIASIDASDKKRVTLEPNGTETVDVAAGDGWQGVYRFDTMLAPNGESVTSADPIRVGVGGVVPLTGPTVAGRYLRFEHPVEANEVTVTGNVAVPSIKATTLTIKSGGNLEAPLARPSTLTLDVSGTLTIEAGALINADALGYAAGQAYPGATASGGNSGGSHIGRGGIYNGSPGTTYGSIYRPQEVGGGSGASATTGGGAIRIRAAQAVVEGAIRANGGGAGSGGRGSAGGSVWVTVDRIVGAGQIEANGGNGEYGTGGGGAVAIEYGDATSVMPTLQARTVATWGRAGGAGSVYKRGPASTYGDVVFDNGSLGGGTELPSLGRGTAQSGTSGNVLVTDRQAEIPSYFIGHWIEITSAIGEAKGTWRIASIDPANKKAVTLEPNGTETVSLTATDRWYGTYRFDRLTIRGSRVTTTDRLTTTAPVILESGGQLLINDAAPTLDAARISLSSRLTGDVIIGTAGAVSDPEGPVKVTAKSSAGVTFNGTAAADGSFSMVVDGPIGETFTITATDSNALPMTSAPVPVAGQITDVNGVDTLTLQPQTTSGGMPVTGAIRLLGPARTGGATVTLASTDASAMVPTTVTIPKGNITASFSIATATPSAMVNATITAATGVRDASATLAILPGASALASITLSPASVESGAAVNGIATLGAPAPVGGAVVVLTSSNTLVASVLQTVVVPQGSTTASFTVTTTGAGNAVISGTYGATHSAALVVLPCASMGAVPSATVTLDKLWFDDDVPTGATATGSGSFTSDRVASGSKSLAIAKAAGAREWSFTGATATLAPAANERLIVHALINPCDPPRQILLAWSDGTTQYRASWGEDLIDPTIARVRVAGVPPGGSWQRLEVLASSVGAAGKALKGLSIKVYGGEVWFDAAGASACSLPAQVPPPDSFPAGDQVWLDDQLPPGAGTWDGNGTPAQWNWDTNQRVSGSASHVEPAGKGYRQHYYYNDPKPVPVNAGDLLITYVLLDPCDPPREVMLLWNDGANWEHRAYWGEDLSVGTRTRIGPLPETGKWVRLEVPAALVGLNDRRIYGWSFAIVDGRAWFDRSGKSSRINLALHKAARQSSDYSPNDVASKAVDGSVGYTTGNGGVMSVTATQANPWWEVDLGSSQPIESVEIRGRNDCCQTQTSNLYVLVSDDSITGTDITTARGQSGISAYHSPGSAGSTQTIDVRRTGRYVRIWRAAQDVLSLPEVFVWAPASRSRLNLAGGKPTKALNHYQSYLPEYGVNGSQNDASNTTGSIYHTNTANDSYWEVDLGASQPVSHIDISARIDCCPEQLTGYYLFTSDQPFTASNFAGTLQQALAGGSVWYQSTFLPMRRVDVNRTARYVRLQKSGAGSIVLSEVQVWSLDATVTALSKPTIPRIDAANEAVLPATPVAEPARPRSVPSRETLISNRP